jgi:hypothetical protein
VIDVDIKNSVPQYVVEGYLTEGETTHRVYITKTLNLDDSEKFPSVDNALVTISDDQGKSASMTLVEPGVYEVSNFTVSQGKTYALTVSIDGKQFTSTQKMPLHVEIDTLQTFAFSFGTSSFVAIVPVRTDPKGIANYYYFDLYKKNKRLEGIYIQSDQFNDGNQMMEPIFSEDVQAGDTIKMDMYCIDRSIYDYWFTLTQNQQGAQPVNPVSNFSGGCLGYFSVRTKNTVVAVIP